MMMRSLENTIYFASVNYALRFQESATSLIAPSGECQAYLPYGQEGVLVQAIDVRSATGLLASRSPPSATPTRLTSRKNEQPHAETRRARRRGGRFSTSPGRLRLRPLSFRRRRRTEPFRTPRSGAD